MRDAIIGDGLGYRLLRRQDTRIAKPHDGQRQQYEKESDNAYNRCVFGFHH
jgi:hypothetical protein